MYGCLVKSMVQRREDSSRGTELQTFIFQVKMYNDKTLSYQTTLILEQLLSIVIVTINYLAKFDTILRNTIPLYQQLYWWFLFCFQFFVMSFSPSVCSQ